MAEPNPVPLWVAVPMLLLVGGLLARVLWDMMGPEDDDAGIDEGHEYRERMKRVQEAARRKADRR